MFFVIVQHVHGTGAEREYFTSGDILHLPFAFNYVVGLYMMLVPQHLFAAGFSRGFRHGKTNSVFCEKKTTACPRWAVDVTLGAE